MTNDTPRPLSDFFMTVNTEKAKPPARIRLVDVGKNKPYAEPVGPYCMVTDSSEEYGKHLPSLWVIATDEVMEFIDQNMLGIEYDSIYFSLIRPVGAKDYVLRAVYNQILGSRVIGVVTADSIPQE